MLRQLKYIVCAAVVGVAGHGAVVSVAPACEPCSSCQGYTNIKATPPKNIRVPSWVAGYQWGDNKNSYPAAQSAPASAKPASGAKSPTAPAPPASTVGNQPNAVAASPAGAASDRASLANRAQALLQAKCVRCHGAGRQESGLDLSSRQTILAGGGSGPAVIPGKPDQSLALKRVRDGEMPPNGNRLSSDEIATLQQWIAAGAP